MLRLSDLELKAEKWALIEGTENMYVSTMGRVKRVYKKSERMLTPYYRKRKPPYYVKVNGKEVKLAHIVWQAFKGPFDSSIHCISHKGLITDDRLINLRKLSKKELGALTGGRTDKARGIYKVNKKKRIVYAFYRSSRAAAKANYCSYQTVLDSCNGKHDKNCTGFDFVWAPKVDARPSTWTYEEG